MKRRSILTAALSLASAGTAFSPLASVAQGTPLRILVGFPPGGSIDATARHLAQGLSERLQRSVVVENRPGAGGQIAANALKAAAPDGNTLFLSNSHALAMIPLTVRNPGYDPVKDFMPVGMVSIANDVLAVNPAVVGNVRTLAEFVVWANANPGKGSVGVPAPASDPEFAVRLLAKAFAADLMPIPYRGDGPVVQDLLAGQIPAGIGAIGAVLQHVRAGRLRVIAVSGPSRLKALPEAPTYAEQGLKGYGVSGFAAVMAPVGTPQDVVQRYNQAISQVVQSQGFAASVGEIGVIPFASTPEDLAIRIRDTGSAFADIVERVGYRIP